MFFFCEKDNIWFHCKDLYSAQQFKKMNCGIKYFCHSSDDFVLTSTNHIWVHNLELKLDETCIIPLLDAVIDLGIPLQRFRDINTVSGTSSVWTSTISVTTPLLDLGYDSMSNLRQITADNSIIQDDFLHGGVY